MFTNSDGRAFAIKPGKKLGFLSSGFLGALTFGYTAEPSTAATFSASNETELYQAMADAQASADASSTINLTGSFALTGTLPAVVGKAIKIETGSNTLTFSTAAAFDVAGDATLTFSGQLLSGNTTLTKNGSGTVVLDGSASGISRIGLVNGETVVEGGRTVTFGTSSGGTLAQLGIATAAGSAAGLTIRGAGTRLVATGTDTTDLSAGGGTSSLTIEDGAAYSTSAAIRVHTPASLGTATINVLGKNSTLDAGSFTSVNGTTYLNVLGGGVVNIVNATSFGSAGNLGYNGARVTAVVSGEGSEWNTGSILYMQRGSLSILNGGVVTSTTANIATTTNGVIPGFSVLVSGTGSEFSASSMTVGTRGTGTLTISDGGKVVVNNGASALVLGGTNVDSRASLNIGGEKGAAAMAAGTLEASSVTLAASAEINFNHTDAGHVFDTAINGSGAINQFAGRTIFNADQTGFSGLASLYGGILEINGILGGAVDVNGGILAGTGVVGDTSNAAGGTIAPGRNGLGTLTIDGTYTSDGGALQIGASLGNSSSPADLLVVTDDTILGTGATRIFVTNLGGPGGETTGDGIKIVDVAGISATDIFILGAPAIGGAYSYKLFQNGITDPTDGDWYLRSAGLAPTVPVYENYPIILLGLTELPTLRQRVGDRYWSDEDILEVPTGVGHGYAGPRNLWSRIEGSLSHSEGSSTTGLSYDNDRYLVQVGIDGLFGDSEKGLLVGGLNVQYGRAHAHVLSPIGNGDNNTDSYSIGATLSWYGNDGVYVDGQASLARLSTDLSADTVGKLVDHNYGNGYALSIEAGRKMRVDSYWSVTPQAQISYNSVNFDTFTDPFNAQVMLESGNSAKGRIGIALDYDESSEATQRSLYTIANFSYDFLDGTAVKVSGIETRFEPASFGAEVGVGGTYRWAQGKYSLHGEALVSTRFDGSDGFRGTIGFSTAF